MHYIVSGTDTEIGKTVVSAMLVQALKALYWKPVQSGLIDGLERSTVQSLANIPQERCLKELYLLKEPLSPHRAAEYDGVILDPEKFQLPPLDPGQPLIIEGAGGLMVPITRKWLYIDIFKRWDLPVILCARTGLGTINHTLLSIEALRSRYIKLHGLIFVGPENEDNIRTIAEFSKAKVLGWVPWLDDLNAAALQNVFEQNFNAEDF